MVHSTKYWIARIRPFDCLLQCVFFFCLLSCVEFAVSSSSECSGGLRINSNHQGPLDVLEDTLHKRSISVGQYWGSFILLKLFSLCPRNSTTTWNVAVSTDNRNHDLVLRCSRPRPLSHRRWMKKQLHMPKHMPEGLTATRRETKCHRSSFS